MNIKILVLSLLIGVLFCCGFTVLHFYLKKPNTCQMTYMFEYPQYVKVSFSSGAGDRSPQYSLYAYSEGKDTEKIRRMSFSGIPVLFIPGSSGSYKQVRSLASVSLRKAIDSRSPYHFDYFAVDLNEEYSALYGGVLDRQTEFVQACILRILGFYRSGQNSHRSVILIGHSMGGIVARGVFLDPDFKKDTVSVVLTIASPHLRPVIVTDYYIIDYYNRVNTYWRKNRQGNLKSVTFISIGGGDRDILIPSEYTYSKEADISIISTAIPTVWKSVDHFCSVWCKELVLVIVRSLFDIVDTSSKQVLLDANYRRNVFHYHLVHRTAGKHFTPSVHPNVITFDPDGNWRESLLRQYSVKEQGNRANTYIMVRLLDEVDREYLSVEAVNLEDKDWVFACIADRIYNNSRICNFGVNLSNLTEILPSSYFKRKKISLNLFTLLKDMFTHVIIRIQPTRDLVKLNIDLHSVGRRLKTAVSLRSSTVIKETEKDASHYEIELQGNNRMYYTYEILVEPRHCIAKRHHAVAQFKVPWRKEDVHHIINETSSKDNEAFPLIFHTSKPRTYSASSNPVVILTLDPACRYSVSVRGSVLTLARMIPVFSPMLWSYVVGTLLLAMAAQLRRLSMFGSCVPFHTALLDGCCSYYIFLILTFAPFVLSISQINLLTPVIPPMDFQTLVARNLFFHFLPHTLFGLAVFINCVLGFGCWFSIIFSGHLVHKTAIRVIANKISFLFSWSYMFDEIMEKFPALVGAVLSGLCNMSCGALGLAGATTFYFLLLTKMFDDFLNNLLVWSVKIIIKRTLILFKSDSSNLKNKNNEKNKETNVKILLPKTNIEKIVHRKSEESSSQSGENVITEESESRQDETTGEDKTKTVVTTEENEETKNGDNSNDSASDTELISGDVSAESSEKVDTCSNDTTSDQLDSFLSDFHFHFTLMLIWFTSTVVYIPCALVWAHNYRYSTKLDPDPSFVISIALIFLISLLWQHGSVPRPNLAHYKHVSFIIQFIAVCVFLYTPVNLYRLPYFIAAALVVIVFHQMFDNIRTSEDVVTALQQMFANIKTSEEGRSSITEQQNVGQQGN